MPGTKSWEELERELKKEEVDLLSHLSKISDLQNNLMNQEAEIRKMLTHNMILRSRAQSAKESLQELRD